MSVDGFSVTVADLHACASTFARLRGRAGTAAAATSAALAGTAGMAGDDAVLGRWRARYDPIAAAVWAATGSAMLTLASIAEKLRETGNAYLAGEHAATPGTTGPPERLPAVGASAIPPGGPPSSTGPDEVPDALAEFYPGGDPGLLRVASAAWMGLAEQLDDVAFAGDSAFRGLVAANTGATFSTMATYWQRQFVRCGVDPLFNAVPLGARELGIACGALADLVEQARAAVLGAAATAAQDMSPLEVPAQLLGRYTLRITELELLVATGGLAVSYLFSSRDQYLRELDRLIDQLRPEDQARLERLSVPPAPTVPAGTGLTDVSEVLGLGLRGSAWDGLPGNHPTPDTIHLTRPVITHILDGEPDGTSGGHASGTGRPGKSEFPPAWSREKILAEALGLARDPLSVNRSARSATRWQIEGLRDGVRTRVIVEDDGEIVTAIPLKGPGVVQNPRMR